MKNWTPLLIGGLMMLGASCSRGADPVAVPLPEKPYAPEAGSTRQQVVLAGGCFWCTEAVYEPLAGVIDVESGYAGGTPDSANYEAVSTGNTRHAEAIRITYDPSVISLGRLLHIFFTIAHDPTTLNRQGADVGPQYRSAFFYTDETQRDYVKAYIDQLQASKAFSGPIVTTLEPLATFFPAEGYHQDYARLNPNQGYIRAVALPKVAKLHQSLPELIEPANPQQPASAE